MFLKVCFPVRRGPPLLQRAGVPLGAPTPAAVVARALNKILLRRKLFK